MELQYDKPIEVTEKQYKKIMNDAAGVCAGRVENGKFYIKLWMPKYKNLIEQIIKNN